MKKLMAVIIAASISTPVLADYKKRNAECEAIQKTAVKVVKVRAKGDLSEAMVKEYKLQMWLSENIGDSAKGNATLVIATDIVSDIYANEYTVEEYGNKGYRTCFSLFDDIDKKIRDDNSKKLSEEVLRRFGSW